MTGRRLSAKEIEQVLHVLESHYRGTKTALNFGTPFQLLISTMLAAQSTDKRVNIVTQALFRDYPDAQAMATLTPEQLEAYIKTVGLYRAKARNIVQTSRILAQKYKDDIPNTREELMRLPGVGRKTANVVLSIAKGVPAIAVDTHVFRVSNRIGLAAADDVRRTEEQLMACIPQEKWSDAHHWLIWHGRKVCTARKPRCTACPLAGLCLYQRNGQTTED